jgi:hypothetical protein
MHELILTNDVYCQACGNRPDGSCNFCGQQEPAMKTYFVVVERTVIQYQEFTVEAETAEDAKREARIDARSIGNIGWDDCHVDDEYEVTECREDDTDVNFEAKESN